MGSSYTRSGVFAVSAPSGAGKTTLNSRLARSHPDIEISVSLTTRNRRPGEVDGQHYHFVDRAEFQKNVDAGRMLEWAEVFGNLYGTSKSEVERITGKGHKVILEIDVQGWRTAKPKLPGALSIFILPPSMADLWERLEKRGTDSPEVCWRRFKAARDEIAAGRIYDYFIVNDDLDRAYAELEAMIARDEPGKTSGEAGKALCDRLLTEFEHSQKILELKTIHEKI
ncbi:guanylate kinase [bacterium]|nr:guanylate kinase [bacterium]